MKDEGRDEYADLCEKWKQRLDDAQEANEPMEVTPAEMNELRRMEQMRVDSLTAQQRLREEFQTLAYGGSIAPLAGWPVVVAAGVEQ